MSAAVILAAGAGRRLGSVAKALLCDRDGRSFLERVHGCACAAGVSRLVVVIGLPHEAATMAEAERLGLPVVHNPAPGRGMSSSVALGFSYAQRCFAGEEAALLWPVDHPSVRPETVRMVLARLSAATIVIPTLAARGGHPTGFGRDLWQDLAACSSAPQGARSIIQRIRMLAPDRVMRIPVDDPGVLADVDTPEQLASQPEDAN